MSGALDDAEFAGTAQTALLHLLFTLGFDDLGIDELDRAFADVDHTDAAHDADLGRGKTYAAGIREGLDHIVEQIPYPLIEFFDRAAFLRQDRVALFHDIT